MKKIQNNQEIPIPEGLEQRLSELVDRLEAEELRTSKASQKVHIAKPTIRRTLYALAAAACILLLLVFHFSQKPAKETPLITEIVEESAPQPAPEPIIEEKKEEPQQPAKPHKTYKSHKTHKTQAEPLLAEAEPIQEEIVTENEQEYLPTEPDPFLLAAAEAQDVRARGERLYQEVAQMINNH